MRRLFVRIDSIALQWQGCEDRGHSWPRPLCRAHTRTAYDGALARRPPTLRSPGRVSYAVYMQRARSLALRAAASRW